MAQNERPRGDDRERQYEHPIPSRDAISAMMEQAGGPLTLPALAGRFDIHGDKHQRALENRLKAMVR
ncbi:MAG: hypothetical protein JXB36_12905, partial [Gammaproteobacteria bacterium]|nr:hypothetical protein [Gammaproteobacteria bacterium]